MALSRIGKRIFPVASGSIPLSATDIRIGNSGRLNRQDYSAIPDNLPSCVGCRSNRRLTGKLTYEKYMSMGHVMAQFGRTRKPSFEEWLLLKYGVKRRIEVAVHSFAMISSVLLGTDRIATMHARLARHFAKTMPLKIVELPVPIPPFSEAIQSPAVHNTDPASIWLRGIVIDEARRMTRPRGEGRRSP